MFNSDANDENRKLSELIRLALIGYNAGIYEWNMLDDSAYYSNEWKQMLGYSDDEIAPLLSSWSNLVHPDDLRYIMKDVQSAVDNHSSTVEAIHRVKHKNGNWVWILGRGYIEYDEDNNPKRMVGIHTDITEQKNRDLKAKHLAQMVEQTHDGIISIDLKGYIQTYNRGAQQLFGYTAQEAIGSHISLIQCYDELIDFSEIIEDLKVNEKSSKDMRFRRKNGEFVDTNISTSILKNISNETIGIVGYIQDITQKKQIQERILRQKEELDYQAHHDYLTNLPNRILFHDRLEHSILKSKREGTRTALFFIDLDHFKEINDKYGHDIGDEVLKKVAFRISNVIRENDTLSRLGGDEFTIVMDGFKNISDISNLAEKVISALEKPIVIGNEKYNISSSIGISIYPDDALSANNILKYADNAMYKAKAKGRNNFQYYKKSPEN